MKKNNLFVLISIGLFSCLSFMSCKEKSNSTILLNNDHLVVVLGNSIVDHGPYEPIGWKGNWGMAASTRDSDFVHLLQHDMQKIDTAYHIQYRNYPGVENGYHHIDLSQLDSMVNPKMIILRYGENVNDSTVSDGQFVAQMEKVITKLDPQQKAIKVIVTSFWPKSNVTAAQVAFAQKHNYILVHNEDLLPNDSTYAALTEYTDVGVRIHPSNKGMLKIKDRIWEKIQPYFKK
jgi:hypothetical protein